MKLRVDDPSRGEGRARVLETDGEHVVLESSLPYPAGATLVGVEPDSGAEYRVKVRGGRRLSDDSFRVEGRFVSLTKGQRQVLLAALKATEERS